MGLSAVFSSVRAVFLVIFGSEATEGAPFSSYIILSTGIRLERRRTMLEYRLFTWFHVELGEIGRKKCQD
jgi:hypothetical protein